MGIASIAGALAVTCTTVHICLGLPAQIRKNFLRKSCEGLSLSMVVMWLSNYISWATYGYFTSDPFVLLAHLPGTVLISVLIFQFFLYHQEVSRAVGVRWISESLKSIFSRKRSCSEQA